MAKQAKVKKTTKGKEGADPEVLDGASGTVRRQRPGLLDRLTGLVVVLFVATSAVRHVVA